MIPDHMMDAVHFRRLAAMRPAGTSVRVTHSRGSAGACVAVTVEVETGRRLISGEVYTLPTRDRRRMVILSNDLEFKIRAVIPEDDVSSVVAEVVRVADAAAADGPPPIPKHASPSFEPTVRERRIRWAILGIVMVPPCAVSALFYLLGGNCLVGVGATWLAGALSRRAIPWLGDRLMEDA